MCAKEMSVGVIIYTLWLFQSCEDQTDEDVMIVTVIYEDDSEMEKQRWCW